MTKSTQDTPEPQRARRADLPPLQRHEMRRCREHTCRRRFYPVREHQEFCCPACRQLWWTRAQTRAGTAYNLLIDWRKKRKVRGGSKGILSEMARIVDDWIREDQLADELDTK